MDIKPFERTVREILSAQKQYVIPRFQREYSWDKRHYNEFLVDMLGNLAVKEGQIVPTTYFMGTMLFVGDAEDKAQRQSQVVDGQQRLTTITILFSVLSNIFMDCGELKLADNVFRYIMAEDDNGNEVRILKTVSSYPYFSYFIQQKDKRDALATTEEEKSIEDAYNYFAKQLQEQNVRTLLRKQKIETNRVPYIDILKALRDQVLMSTIIEIYTSDSSVANKLFEILNAKGKQLSFIDLVKNRIFENVKEIEPADFATETWRDITDLINTGVERTGFATFFRQYWSSKYKKSSSSTIYSDFVKLVKPEEYKDFLRDLKKEASIYKLISNPSRESFNNKKQYYRLVQSLRTFNNYFNVVQVRVPLLALFEAKNRDCITRSRIEEIVSYLENFHFAYNSVLSKSPNKVEPIYSTFSLALRASNTKEEVNRVIEQYLFGQLDALYPKFDEFCKGFVKLSYTKRDNQLNLKTKYALNKLFCFYQEDDLFSDEGSVEHILPESDELSTNIGNLILLEIDLNNEAKDKTYREKRHIYGQSSYKWVQSFVGHNQAWQSNMIEGRAQEMAKIYYEKVLGRAIK